MSRNFSVKRLHLKNYDKNNFKKCSMSRIAVGSENFQNAEFSPGLTFSDPKILQNSEFLPNRVNLWFNRCGSLRIASTPEISKIRRFFSFYIFAFGYSWIKRRGLSRIASAPKISNFFTISIVSFDSFGLDVPTTIVRSSKKKCGILDMREEKAPDSGGRE